MANIKSSFDAIDRNLLPPELGAWVENITKARYSGIAFYTENGTFDVKRSNTINNIPFSNKYNIQDLGIESKTHSVKAYFIGDQYLLDRKQFIEALEMYGGKSRPLKLPSLDEVNVKVAGWSLGWSSVEGGVETLTINFVEITDEEDLNKIEVVVDTKNNVLEKSSIVQDSSIDAVSDGLVLEGQPSFVSEDLFEGFKNFAEQAAEIASFASGVLGEISKIKSNPLAYATDVFTVLTGTKNAYNSLKGAYHSIKGFMSWIFDDVSKPTTGVNNASRAINNNRALLEANIHIGTVKTLSEIAIELEYNNKNEANNIQTEMVGFFDTVLAEVETIDYKLYKVVNDLKRSYLEDSLKNGASLPQIKIETINKELPALFIAYNEYADSSRYNEVANRNNAVNPLFIGPGEIEVLTS